MSNIWKRMPESNGLFFHCVELKDRDVSQIIGVEKIEYPNGEKFLRRSRGDGDPIGSHEGWWLKISDERITAQIEDTQ